MVQGFAVDSVDISFVLHELLTHWIACGAHFILRVLTAVRCLFEHFLKFFGALRLCCWHFPMTFYYWSLNYSFYL